MEVEKKQHPLPGIFRLKLVINADCSRPLELKLLGKWHCWYDTTDMMYLKTYKKEDRSCIFKNVEKN